MWRIAPCLLLMLSSSSVAQAPRLTMPDVLEAGRVLGQLDPTQGALFACLFVIVAMMINAALTGLQQGKSRQAEQQINRDLAAAIDRLATAMQSNSTDIKVQLALIQQNQANILGGVGKAR